MTENPNAPRKAQEIDVLLGQRIKQCRIAARLSQTAVGEELGLSFQQIQKYERGTNRVTVARLFEFADVLGTSLGYFLNDLERDRLLPNASAKSRAVDYQLLAMLSEIPDIKTKRLVTDLVRALATSANEMDQ
jgi:transcriptional regulator with XRE-family HTH domain